ncbi:hypothetical protein NADFUDRAFT_83917 [Nadsonia fulvescens var. elongata DSM 6958]|uniref:Peroxisomal membrane protein PEX14 n=1 Tax=Nadsonia fulvescens var. elongata DSM 6958 TaxID=857566 RepID=A0A1E3PEH8_9ASCO|nr:hypothetical protein NADFUDRAFT_83917 [Nadsonia fulvescens var. elongata DSM 6958]
MREELVHSAVKFLQNPEIASAPLAKRIEFLESKELTQPEIQEALKRCGAPVSGTDTTQSSSGATGGTNGSAAAPATHRQASPATTYNAPSYVTNPYPNHPPPVPARDWRDTFITATTTVGLAYGLYLLARKYVIPAIMPPTPSALDADKKALEEEFAKVQLSLVRIEKDTSEMKSADEAQSEEIARVLADVEASIEKLTAEAQKREEEMRLIKAEVGSVRETLPISIEKLKYNQDTSLQELMSEVKSLKQLLGSRARIEKSTTTSVSSIPRTQSPDSSATPVDSTTSTLETGSSSSPSSSSPPVNSASPVGLPRAGIPAWQLAATAKKN